jgi:predicted TIM-barrel enzyme
MTREQALKRLHSQVAAGRVLIGAGAGTGLGAKSAEAGGADLLIIYDSRRYRMAGRGSLAGLMPYADANAIVMEMAAELLTIVKDTPVLAGVCGTDPFRRMPSFLREIRDVGFTGVQNFPTPGLIDCRRRRGRCPCGADHGRSDRRPHRPHTGRLRSNRPVRSATLPPVPCLKSSSSATGARSLSQSPPRTSLPERPEWRGFFGASSLERLPVERAMSRVTRECRAIDIAPSDVSGSE